MNSADLVTMLGNLSRSMFSIQHLVSGFAYLIGLVFFFLAISKFKKMAESGGRSQEKMFVPVAYLLGGAALLFLPTAVTILTNTSFGSGNVLEYSPYHQFNIYKSMRVIIQTIGLIWFIRGCVLLVGSSQPGVQHGAKGLMFLFAGILAMNFEGTVAMLTNILARITSFTLTVKNAQGY